MTADLRAERGQVWWADVDGRCPVVLLGGDEPAGIRAMQIVAPATAEERRGFLLLSGEDALAGPAPLASGGVRGVGVEVEFGAAEGLPDAGVVRLALPVREQVFCTWLVTLTADALIERAGVLSPAKLAEFDHALRLAGIE